MMKKQLLNLFALALCALATLPLHAQLRTPAASPTAELKQQVGLTDVAIVYSRPSAKERKIFAADGLVPYGEVWRTGANQATKFSFGTDVTLGGQALKAGDYAVLTKPGADQWEVMLYNYETGNFGSYLEKTPAAKLTAKPGKTADKVETFLISLNNLTATGATIDLVWENTVVSLPLEVPSDKMVMDQIDRVMNGPTANDYFAAASYYHDAGKDLKQAYEWVKKANSDNPQFWMLRRQALIEADLGMHKEAIATATKSKELAMKANNQDYVRMNEASIAEWSKKEMK